jgi:transposase
MAKNWITPDREQLLLLAPSISEWVPENHLARYVVEVVERLDLSEILSKYTIRAHGSNPYHPSLLTALLFYGYATGVMSSRKIEQATYDSVPFRYIAGGHHPDHATLSEFRRRHLKELSALFLQILLLAREMGFLKVGTVALDGTKVKANASKHAAVSYKKSKQIESQLREEIKELMRAAEGADNTPLEEGVEIPAEISRREKRIRKLQEAQRAIEERHGREAVEKYEEESNEYIEKTKQSVEKTLNKKKGGGKKPPDPPSPPPLTPDDKAQHNFSDPDSRIMPDKGSFSQAYNAQVSVDTETMLIVGHHLTQNTNDKKELIPALNSIAEELGVPTEVLADAGYFSEDNIKNAPEGTELYISPGRVKHHQTIEERLGPATTGEAPVGATPAQAMRHKLKSEIGRQLYRLRKMTVEPSIGIIKEILGLRQFLLRGRAKVPKEWGLVCLGYNLKRMWALKTARKA